jgi:hypothetical protein
MKLLIQRIVSLIVINALFLCAGCGKGITQKVSQPLSSSTATSQKTTSQKSKKEEMPIWTAVKWAGEGLYYVGYGIAYLPVKAAVGAYHLVNLEGGWTKQGILTATATIVIGGLGIYRQYLSYQQTATHFDNMEKEAKEHHEQKEWLQARKIEKKVANDVQESERKVAHREKKLAAINAKTEAINKKTEALNGKNDALNKIGDALNEENTNKANKLRIKEQIKPQKMQAKEAKSLEKAKLFETLSKDSEASLKRQDEFMELAKETNELVKKPSQVDIKFAPLQLAPIQVNQQKVNVELIQKEPQKIAVLQQKAIISHAELPPVKIDVQYPIDQQPIQFEVVHKFQHEPFQSFSVEPKVQQVQEPVQETLQTETIEVNHEFKEPDKGEIPAQNPLQDSAISDENLKQNNPDNQGGN